MLLGSLPPQMLHAWNLDALERRRCTGCKCSHSVQNLQPYNIHVLDEETPPDHTLTDGVLRAVVTGNQQQH